MARRGKGKCSEFFIKLDLFHFNGFSSCCHSIFSVVLYFLNQIMMLFYKLSKFSKTKSYQPCQAPQMFWKDMGCEIYKSRKPLSG